jgi:UDP-N-acetylmuramoyl-tripeptide--D-alanyl-D-alanine ligase
MGASYPHDIKLLCSIVSPTHGLITNIGTAHIEKFGSKQQLIKTKTDLYRAVINNNGIIFINSDDQLLTSLLNYNKTFSYGSNPKADTYGYLIDSQFTMNFAFRTKNNQILTVKTNLFGDYNLYNALAAVAVGQFWNIPDNLIASAIQNYSPDNYRSQILKTPNNLLILDLYNANPTSMSKALHSFKLFNAQNKTLILGDMLELGNIALEEHQKIVSLAENLGFKNTFLIGPIFSKTNTTFPKFLSTDDFARFLSDNPLKNKTILLKASRGIHLEKLIKLL